MSGVSGEASRGLLQMNDVVQYVEAEDLEKLTLEELFTKACGYGRLDLKQHHDLTWTCHIRFATTAGISLEATSEYDHKEPHNAIVLAIVRAQEIRKQFK